MKIKKNSEEALLLVTFGSTMPRPQETFAKIRAEFAHYFADMDQYMAWTSRICMKRWKEKTGEEYHPVDYCLERLAEAGYKKINIQSLHIIPGLEYSFITDRFLPKFKEKYPEIKTVVGTPLLMEDCDIARVGDAIITHYQDRLNRGEMLILMGHGNNTDKYPEANNKYIKLNEYMQKCYQRIVIGTVDFEEMLFDTVLSYVEAVADCTKAINLAPLMSVAGDHACNDMAGDEEDELPMDEQSWRTQLLHLGYRVDKEKNCFLVGLGDYPEIRRVWVEHLKEAIRRDI